MNDEVPTLLTEDILGEFGFRVVWSYLKHWADVKVYEIVARGGEKGDAPLFHRNGALSSPDDVQEIERAEVYLEGYFKWDGCLEFESPRHHFCGEDQLIKHCMLFKHLWQRAHELMDGSDFKVPNARV